MPQGGKEVAELVKKHAIRNIHALILNDNSLGAEGIIALCDVSGAVVAQPR